MRTGGGRATRELLQEVHMIILLQLVAYLCKILIQEPKNYRKKNSLEFYPHNIMGSRGISNLRCQRNPISNKSQAYIYSSVKLDHHAGPSEYRE